MEAAYADPKSFAREHFGELAGELRAFDATDGARMIFAGDKVIHLRPSGNAPEFRCYTEADTAGGAEKLNAEAMAVLRDRVTPAFANKTGK